MKDKILQALKTKYVAFGFNALVLENMADVIASKVTEESQIETEVSGVEPLLKTFQSFADSRVTEAVKKATAKSGSEGASNEGKEGKEGDDGKDKGEQSQNGLTELMKTVNALTQEIASLKEGKSKESRTERFKELIKEVPDKQKSLLEKSFQRMNFQTDEEFETFVTETKTDVDAIIADTKASAFAGFGVPPQGGSSQSTIDAQIENWAKQGQQASS